MVSQELEVPRALILGGDEFESMIRELSNEEEYHIRGFEDQYEKLGRKRLTDIPFMWLRGVLHENIGVFGLDNAGSCTIGAALRGCSENKGISDSGAEVGFSYDLMGLSIVAKLTDLNKVILFPLVTVHRGKCKQQKGRDISTHGVQLSTTRATPNSEHT